LTGLSVNASLELAIILLFKGLSVKEDLFEEDTLLSLFNILLGGVIAAVAVSAFGYCYEKE